MGLFDSLRVQYAHPDIDPEEIYQTKNTPLQHLQPYTLTADGRLMQHLRETEIAEEARPHWAPLFGDAELIVTGRLYFIGKAGQFCATLDRGRLISLRKVADDVPDEEWMRSLVAGPVRVYNAGNAYDVEFTEWGDLASARPVKG
jgi:hypothetical protein